MAGFFKKFSFGLKKSRDKMSNAIDEMLDSFDTFEDDLFIHDGHARHRKISARVFHVDAAEDHLRGGSADINTDASHNFLHLITRLSLL